MSFLNKVAEHYGKEPGKMLIHTGVIGWILSSLAQIVAIATNDKISKEQKSFLIPQEAADALVNILSFYTITQTISGLTRKMMVTGKLLPKSVSDYLTKKGCSIGNLKDNVKKIIAQKDTPTNISKDFENFYAGSDVVATTIGSILSCNIVTPIIRNKIAAKGQKDIMKKYQNDNKPTYEQPKINPYMNNSTGMRI